MAEEEEESAAAVAAGEEDGAVVGVEEADASLTPLGCFFRALHY